MPAAPAAPAALVHHHLRERGRERVVEGPTSSLPFRPRPLGVRSSAPAPPATMPPNQPLLLTIAHRRALSTLGSSDAGCDRERNMNEIARRNAKRSEDEDRTVTKRRSRKLRRV